MGDHRVVPKTAELERILALPRRPEGGGEELIEGVTRWLTRVHDCGPDCCVVQRFRRPDGTEAKTQFLRPNADQALCVVELGDSPRGMFVQFPVGRGKTWVTAVAGTVKGSKKPVLFVPGALRGKTLREFRVLAEHWRVKHPIVKSYTELSMAAMSDFLERYQPDLVMGDEGHNWKDRRGPRAKRMWRFIKEWASAHQVAVVDLTGTGMKRSILDAAHRLRWCLGDDGSPLPVHESELLMWAAAVDEKVSDRNRLGAGALRALCTEEEVKDGIAGLRRAVGRRIFETPGCVRSREAGVDASLVVELVDQPLSQVEDEAFRWLREEWMTPDEHDVADRVALWRHARELALGFFYRWDPRPPREWVEARRAWCKAVRGFTSANRHGVDTELQVVEEVRAHLERGKRHPLAKLYQEWLAVKDTFEPNTVPVWTGDTAVDRAVEWLRDKKAGAGIVWAEHVAFGRRVAEVAGVPYFGAGGLDARRRPIESCPAEPCVASIASCGTGRNLQAWHRSWVPSVMPTGTVVEQLLGRTHRTGQDADVVEYSFAISCREQLEGFEQAERDAAFHRDLLDAPARLTIADIVRPEFEWRGQAWAEQRPPEVEI